MTTNTPVFGPQPDLDEFKHNMANFDVEMFRFTDISRIRARHVNVLHFGTDLATTKHEMDRVAQFMMLEGYRDMKHKQGSQPWGDTDMLIVGSDESRSSAVKYVLWSASTGLFGLVLYWDALWYGTDYTPQSDLPVGVGPLCSGPKFSQDAICLAHAHIRRRDDIIALRGTHNSILVEIESRMDEMMKKDETWNMRSKDKIKKFRKKLEGEGYSGPDVDLFFAAINVLRHSRNFSSHPLRSMPQKKLNQKVEQGERFAAEFDRLAKKHNRPFVPPTFASQAQADPHTVVRWESRIAHMAATWLDEYSKLP